MIESTYGSGPTSTLISDLHTETFVKDNMIRESIREWRSMFERDVAFAKGIPHDDSVRLIECIYSGNFRNPEDGASRDANRQPSISPNIRG